MTDADSNPFADPEENPFAASGVQSGGAQSAGLDDYNPFAKQTTTSATASLPPPKPADHAPPAVKSAVIEPSYEPPPPYQPSSAQQVDTSELQRRQEELERKATELQEREQRLRDRTLHGAKDNNWPPLPACCPVRPCFYQDVDLDIPPEFQRVTKLAYYTWIARALMYMLNFILSIGYISVAKGTLAAGTTVGLAILWIILFVPLSFLCWYRPVYKAFRSDSSINFFAFFVVTAVQILVDIFIILGPDGTGYLGLLTAIPMLNGASSAEHNMGGVMFIVIILACPLLCLDIFLLIKVHKLYRGTGASFQKAQSEFATGVMKNEGVRNAGAQMATDAATGAVANAASGNSSANRY